MANRTAETERPRTTDGRGAAPRGERVPPSDPTIDDRSVGDLIRELANEGTRLIRQEIELAKAEMRETAKVYERSVMKLAAAGLFLAGALFMVYVAANRGLTALLEGAMPLETALWVSPLILAVLSAVVGWILVTNARKTMSDRGVAPRKAISAARDEANWLKHEAKEMRND